MGLSEQGELLGVVHDLGKYSTEFQGYLKFAVGLLNQDEDEEFVDAKGLKGKVDHSTAGAQLIWQELASRGALGVIAGQVLSLCVASHHSGLIDCLGADQRSFGEDVFTRRMRKPDDRTHLPEVLSKVDRSISKRIRELFDNPAMISALQRVLAQIMVRAPEKDDKTIVVQQQFGLLVRFLFSCLVDADRIDTADFESLKAAKLRPQGKYTNWKCLLDRLEQHLANLKPKRPIDHLRRDISRHCLDAAFRTKGVYTLTVPTGGGKTLASLRFALHHVQKHGMDRVVYVIPFTSIIDQNAAVVRKIVESEGTEPGTVLLEHHSNLTPEEQTWRGKILSENWDAPLIYTTMVQFLEALFGGGTRGARRMHQLANAVLIFDEVQTLPVNCVHLFNNAINFLVEQCGSTVVLCTATQPLLDKVDLTKGAIRIPEGNELMPDVHKLFEDLRRVEVKNRRKPGGWTMGEVADLALLETDRAGSCLVIVNTKKAAQSLHRLCREQADHSVCHLSTNMCPAHRKAVLAEVRQRLDQRKPTLCVSTQLIEAGVDVDFGAVIRFTAGLDSIAQAAGRCNRNGRPEPGIVHVVNPSAEDERLGMLPDIQVGKEKAEWVLDDYQDDPARFKCNPIGPEAMNLYYERYFFARQKDMDYQVSAKTLGHDDGLLNLLALNSQAEAEHRRVTGRKPEIYLRHSFMAAAKIFKAIEAPSRGVIVPFGEVGKEIVAALCSAYMPDKEPELLRRAQQFSVNLFPQVLERFSKAGVVQEIQQGIGILFLADSRYYSAELGLTETPEGAMEVLCV